MSHKPLVLSGMQPTNTLHLGNYLGALKNWVRMQEEMPCLFCVVDMHAITQDAGYGKPSELTQATREVTAAYIAAGVDPARTPIFNHGQVPEHLELARDIAKKFDNDFGVPDFFPQPEPVITGTGTRVMSLRDGTKKMSKSDESDMSRINLTDDADAIANKIKRAKTDPHPLPASKEELKDRPEAENLLNIYAALADRDRDAVIAQFAGQQFSGFKAQLADLTVAKLEPIAANMRRLLGDPGEIDRILKDGAARARAIATPIMAEVKKRVGFIS